MSKTSAYDALTPAVRELVDRKVEEYALEVWGLRYVTDEWRANVTEAIASRVETRTYRPEHGRGH